MAQYIRLPSASVTATNPSVGTTGSTPPTSATEVGGVNASGNLQALQLDSSGNLKITGSISASNPSVSTTGASVPASATYGGMNVAGNLTGLTGTANGLKVDGSAVTQPVSGTVTANAGTGTMAVSAAALPLPAGAATSAKQPALGTAGAASADVISVQGIASMTALKVDGSAVTQPISAASLPLPSGAATSALQTSLNALFPSSIGTKASAASLSVVLASDQATVPTNQAGRSTANAPVRNDYTGVNVTTSAYVQLVASTTSATSEIEIFDSSGQTLYLATGAAASEVNQIIIFPGGNGRIPLKIAAGTRVSIKAISATANSGEIDINFYA